MQNNFKIFKNSFWIIGSKIFQIGIGFFVTAMTTRYLGPSNYGYIEYVNAYVAFITSFATLGINDVILKEIVDNKEKEGEYLGASLILRLLSSLLSIICLVSIISILNPGDKLLQVVALVQSLSLLFQSFEIFNYWYHAQLMSKISSIISTIVYLLVVLYRIYLLVFHKNIIWFASVTTIEMLLNGVLLIISYKKNGGKKLKFNKNIIKPILSKSHHFIYSGLMIAIYSQMDKIMIEHWLSKTDVGYYSSSTSLSSMWGFILAAIIQSFYSAIVEAKKIDEKLYILRIKQLYSLVIWTSIFVSSFISVFSKEILNLLYGSAYLPATKCLRIVSWFTGLAYLGSARAPWMLCENNQKYQKYILGLGSITNIILNCLLIPKFGIEGAAIATLVTQSMTSFFGPMFFKKLKVNSIYILDAINPKYIYSLFKENKK